MSLYKWQDVKIIDVSYYLNKDNDDEIDTELERLLKEKAERRKNRARDFEM